MGAPAAGSPRGTQSWLWCGQESLGAWKIYSQVRGHCTPNHLAYELAERRARGHRTSSLLFKWPCIFSQTFCAFILLAVVKNYKEDEYHPMGNWIKNYDIFISGIAKLWGNFKLGLHISTWINLIILNKKISQRIL